MSHSRPVLDAVLSVLREAIHRANEDLDREGGVDGLVRHLGDIPVLIKVFDNSQLGDAERDLVVKQLEENANLSNIPSLNLELRHLATRIRAQ